MPNEANYLDITLFGKEYRVVCPSKERDALLDAVAFVDKKMHDIAEKTKSNISERIAVMAVLSIAHEQFSRQKHVSSLPEFSESEIGVEIDIVKRKISDLDAQLEAVLAPREEFF